MKEYEGINERMETNELNESMRGMNERGKENKWVDDRMKEWMKMNEYE